MTTLHWRPQSQKHLLCMRMQWKSLRRSYILTGSHTAQNKNHILPCMTNLDLISGVQLFYRPKVQKSLIFRYIYIISPLGFLNSVQSFNVFNRIIMCNPNEINIIFQVTLTHWYASDCQVPAALITKNQSWNNTCFACDSVRNILSTISDTCGGGEPAFSGSA